MITTENLDKNTIAGKVKPDIPIIVNGVVPLQEAFEFVEKQLVLNAYKKSKNSYAVAKSLGISQSKAHRKIQKYIK